ncbi:hypothetical protein Ddye_031296 [Dipteronia dyeriana]|uniref:Uncharacterized protein n=1 Tax=Dipteronia dyeriana TaxID=168575 RepID=A0AAD9TI17_9ROSI|nr:hypothetical protein Ddye_031296 [Dipteronia dyeriana]
MATCTLEWTASVRRYGATRPSILLSTASSARISTASLPRWDLLLLCTFNAGMFVFKPSRLTYKNIFQTLMITPPTAFGEQVSLITVNLKLLYNITKLKKHNQ